MRIHCAQALVHGLCTCLCVHAMKQQGPLCTHAMRACLCTHTTHTQSHPLATHTHYTPYTHTYKITHKRHAHKRARAHTHYTTRAHTHKITHTKSHTQNHTHKITHTSAARINARAHALKRPPESSAEARRRPVYNTHAQTTTRTDTHERTHARTHAYTPPCGQICRRRRWVVSRASCPGPQHTHTHTHTHNI